MDKLSYTLGYIDEDDGQKTTFFNHFKDDYEKVTLFDLTAETTVDSLIKDIEDSKLNLLIIDYELTGDGEVDFDADELVEALLVKYPHYPYIILTSNENDAIDHIHDPNVIYCKEDLTDRLTFFKSVVKSNIEEYLEKIDFHERVIEELVKKKIHEGLDPKEEEALSRAFIYLDDIYINDKELPANLMEYREQTNLNNLAKEAKEIKELLQSLKHDS